MKAFAAVARKDGFASQLEGLELLPQVPVRLESAASLHS